nr:hypothetical protein [Tanacetum cinerariifolium]
MSSNDNTNVINAPQEPFVFNHDLGEIFSQSPPHINHHCCYGCGDSLDGIFCQRCTCESCGNGAHIFYNCPPKDTPIYYDDDDDEESSTPLRDIIISKLPPCIAITPVLSTEEPKDSLIMGDEHLDTIPKKESDELIKSSVKNLVSNPSESKDLSDIKSECDVPEFSGELAHIDLISLEINETNFDPEEEIRFVERLLYDNSSPRPPKEFNFENSDAIIKSFSPTPIPVEDNDSFMEEIDLFLTPDDSIPSGIENDDYDSEGDIIFLE